MSRRISLYLTLLLLLAITNGCGGDATEPQESRPAGNTPGQVVDLPDGTESDDLEIVAGADSATVRTDGSFRIFLADTSQVQAVFVVNEQDRPIYMSMHTPGTGSELRIGAEETAYSLVLMHPLLMTADPQLTLRARTFIGELSTFPNLVEVLDTRIRAGYLLGDPDVSVETALGAVFDEYTTTLAEGTRKALAGKDVGPVNGLTLVGPSTGADELSYSVENSMKRWISVYASTKQVGMAAGDYEFLELLPSPGISLLQIMLDLVQNGSVSWPTIEGEQHTVPLLDLEAIDLRCYGLGSDIAFDDTDLEYALEPMICSVVFDIGLPIVSVISGGGDMELRGRPRNHPLMYFVSHAATNCPELSATVYEGIRNQHMPDVIFPLIDCFTEQIIDHPRIFADLVNQILMDQLGAQVARRVVTSWLWPVRVVNAVVTGVNIGWTLASVLNSETVTDFHIDAGNGPEMVTTVYGIVTDAATGDPLEGVAVNLGYVGGSAVGLALTDADGEFAIEAPVGNLSVTCSMIGYQSSTQYFEIPASIAETVYLPTALLAEPSDEPGSFGGSVIDAASGWVLPGAMVTVTRGLNVPETEVLYTVVSNSNGGYQFENVPAGSYTVEASKDGYISQFIYVTVVGGLSLGNQDVTISPVFSGDLRFVLTWGETPTDLDSHMVTPVVEGSVYHILWNDLGSLYAPPYAALDVDDVTSWGPETITVETAYPGVYRYAVYQWSSAGSLPTSNAHVVLYAGDSVMREWSVPTQGSGRWWNICEIDVLENELTDINVLQDSAPAGMSLSKNGVVVK